MDKLGIDPVQLLLQIFNFVVMVVLLTKFLYRPILKILEERKKKIAEGLEYAQKAKLEEEKAARIRQEIISIAKEESRKIIAEGKLAGKRLEQDIIEKAHKEAQSIIEKGRSDLAVKQEELEKRLKDKTVTIAEAMLKSLLADILTERNQKQIIEKKLLELSKQVK